MYSIFLKNQALCFEMKQFFEIWAQIPSRQITWDPIVTGRKVTGSNLKFVNRCVKTNFMQTWLKKGISRKSCVQNLTRSWIITVNYHLFPFNKMTPYFESDNHSQQFNFSPSSCADFNFFYFLSSCFFIFESLSCLARSLDLASRSSSWLSAWQIDVSISLISLSKFSSSAEIDLEAVRL